LHADLTTNSHAECRSYWGYNNLHAYLVINSHAYRTKEVLICMQILLLTCMSFF